MEGVLDLFPETESKGIATISHIVFSEKEDPLFNMRAVRDGGWLFHMTDGKYVRLHLYGELVMSDTQMERRSNSDFVYVSHGRVLIAGLGIGLVLKNILPKKEVTEIVVIEKYQDVIDLVAPKFTDPRIRIICADIFDWRPQKGEKFNVIYFDVWSDLCKDNLDEIKKLHNSFKSYVDRTDLNCSMNSWMKTFLRNRRRQEQRTSYW